MPGHRPRHFNTRYWRLVLKKRACKYQTRCSLLENSRQVRLNSEVGKHCKWDKCRYKSNGIDVKLHKTKRNQTEKPMMIYASKHEKLAFKQLKCTWTEHRCACMPDKPGTNNAIHSYANKMNISSDCAMCLPQRSTALKATINDELQKCAANRRGITRKKSIHSHTTCERSFIENYE